MPAVVQPRPTLEICAQALANSLPRQHRFAGDAGNGHNMLVCSRRCLFAVGGLVIAAPGTALAVAPFHDLNRSRRCWSGPTPLPASARERLGERPEGRTPALGRDGGHGNARVRGPWRTGAVVRREGSPSTCHSGIPPRCRRSDGGRLAASKSSRGSRAGSHVEASRDAAVAVITGGFAMMVP